MKNDPGSVHFKMHAKTVHIWRKKKKLKGKHKKQTHLLVIFKDIWRYNSANL